MDKDIITSFIIASLIGAIVAGTIINKQHPLLPTEQHTNLATTTKAGPSYAYPNPAITPGDVLTTDKEKICVKGYSSSVRNVTTATKKKVYEEYGVAYPQPEGSNEVDHFISLELGGSNDIKNLWIEPASPKPGFHEKDAVENYLHKEVCDGLMSLVDAQEAIAHDWYAIYLMIQH